MRRGQAPQRRQHGFEVIGRVVVAAQSHPPHQIQEHVVVGARFADRFDHRARQLQRHRPVALCVVVVFQEGRRRQDDVGVQRRVGEHLIEHHGEQVFAREPLEHARLIGERDRGIAVVDEQAVDGRAARRGQLAADVVHVDGAGRRLLIAEPRLLDAPARGIAHRVAAAADAELAGHRRERQDRRRGAAAVPVALESPSAFDQRRTGRRVPLGQLLQPLGRHARHLGSPLECPRRRPFTQQLGAGRVGGQEREVGAAGLEEVAVDRQGHDQIGARPDGEVQVRLTRDPGRARIDHDDPGAALTSLLEVGHQVDAGGAGVDAPDDDQARGRIVLVDDRRHLAVEPQVGGAGRRRAHGARAGGTAFRRRNRIASAKSWVSRPFDPP